MPGEWEGPLVSPGSGLPMAGVDWPDYGGTSAGQRFSTLDQITPANVAGLTLAWHFRTGGPLNSRPAPSGPCNQWLQPQPPDPPQEEAAASSADAKAWI